MFFIIISNTIAMQFETMIIDLLTVFLDGREMLRRKIPKNVE